MGTLAQVMGQRAAFLSIEQIIEMLEELGPDVIARLHGRLPQVFAQLLQGAAHLRLHGSDGTAAYEGDLFVSQIGVLAKEENFLLLGPQTKDGLPQAFLGFLLFQGLRGRRLFAEEHAFPPGELASSAMPGAALEIAGDVQPDPEDPSA
jgi:hypothetical protein